VKLSAAIPKSMGGEPFIARIGGSNSRDDKEAVVVLDEQKALPNGYKRTLKFGLPHAGEVPLPRELEYLTVGDIVRVNPRAGEIRVLYRRDSPHNVLFFTERCNSRCLMCSQPPRAYDDTYLLDDILQAIPLMSPETKELCITGGEPTLVGKKILQILEATKRWLPNTGIHVLTNGRLLSLDLARQIAAIDHANLMFGIPLYSDIASKHDFVVQAKGAFDQTLHGIMNLERVAQRIEIRFVIHKHTFERLPQTARFIRGNVPFVEQVALMGLEMMGFAKTNVEALWIDPADYQPQLRAAVRELSQSGVKVMVYNHQLCVLDRELWPFARRSISDWKNMYMPECRDCALKDRCGGFFASATLRYSRHIKPVSACELPMD
jgi:His-Xaa-Ser system radical SAM maturase HxsC